MNKQAREKAIAYIDSWLRFRYEKLDMPGFVLAIGDDTDVLFEQAYGYANLEQRDLMKSSNIFRIASHSKTFTATAVMQLAEAKQLSIDEPLVTYLTWLSQHRDRRMKRITARQLLSHSAGTIRDGHDANFWLMTNPFPDVDEFKRNVMDTELVLENNMQMKYSNFGYSLLGCLVEKISGIPFNRYASENIVQPLQLQDTGPEFDQAIAPKLVTGYSRTDSEKHRTPIEAHLDTRAMSAATGFYSTAADLCKYFQAHFPGSGQLLSDESKKEMQRAQWQTKNSQLGDAYGLGFMINNEGGRKLFGHEGGFPGQKTRTYCDAEGKLVVVVLTNCIDGDARSMGKGIVSIINHFETSAAKSDANSIDQLRRFQGRFINIWCDIDIVENGRGLIAVDPNSWCPLADERGEKLEVVDDATLRIGCADQYHSEGEPVLYNFGAGNKVGSIRYAGCDMLPEAAKGANPINCSANSIEASRLW